VHIDPLKTAPYIHIRFVGLGKLQQLGGLNPNAFGG